jgi:hypothetical protein
MDISIKTYISALEFKFGQDMIRKIYYSNIQNYNKLNKSCRKVFDYLESIIGLYERNSLYEEEYYYKKCENIDDWKEKNKDEMQNIYSNTIILYITRKTNNLKYLSTNMSINEILYDITFNSLKRDLSKKIDNEHIIAIIASFCCRKLIKSTVDYDFSERSIESLCYMNLFLILPSRLISFRNFVENLRLR